MWGTIPHSLEIKSYKPSYICIYLIENLFLSSHKAFLEFDSVQLCSSSPQRPPLPPSCACSAYNNKITSDETIAICESVLEQHKHHKSGENFSFNPLRGKQLKFSSVEFTSENSKKKYFNKEERFYNLFTL